MYYVQNVTAALSAIAQRFGAIRELLNSELSEHQQNKIKNTTRIRN